ncbi:hypothetical protein WA026_016373 [Henosepilachna vigintioctopunctata]|uniref:CDT1 Geminin-binding domain-containing protein n=1 Tax=Henosepilachna vigintioctopunctata TaxID=420089 RepID=A0AAW1UK69_9CUCU
MSQPSVAAYFNTRKRVANEDAKINRARKVLIVDDEEDKGICEDTSKCIESDESSSADLQKLAPNKIVHITNNNDSMAKNVIKPRSVLKKRVVLGTKGQQNLNKFVTKACSEETVASNVNLPIGDIQEKHFTPPASPVKSSNAMDKISEKPKDSSLNTLKLKLSRSSRLAELKASLSKFNDSYNKLKEVEKVTSKISVNPKASPKLQAFKSIELEVNLSPQKVQSPEKQYLSPRKDTTARKNLLNLLSPTKNLVSLCESPSKKIYDLASKPALTLPYKYRYIAEMFRSIDTVCQLLYNRKETITLSKLKPAVEKMTKRNMGLRCLTQIKHIYPEAFEYQQEKIRVFGSGKREEKWELVLKPLVGGSDHMTSDILLSRKRMLFNLLLDKVKDYHDEFLKALDPPMSIPKDKITRWHPEFDIERVPDVEEDELPEAPEERKFTSGQEVLNQARQMFNCNTRMEEALERLKVKKEEEGTLEKTADNSFPNSILKGIPKALLEKVRQKQAAKALMSMTRSADKEEEIKIYSRLPELARLTRNLFVSEKKGVLPLDVVVEKLGNCYRFTLTKTEMENHIKLLAKELTDWVVLHNIRNAVFVKLDKKADLSNIISKLEDLSKEKNNP